MNCIVLVYNVLHVSPILTVSSYINRVY